MQNSSIFIIFHSLNHNFLNLIENQKRKNLKKEKEQKCIEESSRESWNRCRNRDNT